MSVLLWLQYIAFMGVAMLASLAGIIVFSIEVHKVNIYWGWVSVVTGDGCVMTGDGCVCGDVCGDLYGCGD
jgi:hypothetical protein